MLVIDLKIEEKKIEFEKIGISFRPFNDKELDLIINKYNNDKLLEIVKECYKNYTGKINKKKIEEEDFTNYLSSLYVVDISKDKLNKYIDEWTNYSFLRRIFNLYNELYLNYNDNSRNHYERNNRLIFVNDYFDSFMRRPLFMRKNLIKNEISDYDICGIVVYYLLKKNKIDLINSDCSKYNDYIKKLVSFFSESNTDDIEKMVDILEFWFTDTFNNKNKLVNNVLVLESLLVSSNSNIEKNFVAKCGLLVYRTKSDLSNNNSEKLSAILNFIYSIRSDVVHGNINNVYNDYNILKNKIGDIIEFSSSNSRKRKRDEIYSLAYKYSHELVVITIKFWLDNKNELDFIRDNVVM